MTFSDEPDLVEIIEDDIYKFYQVGKLVGRGTFGCVRVARKLKKSNAESSFFKSQSMLQHSSHYLAVKSINLEKLKENNDLKMLSQELEVIKNRRHLANSRLLQVLEIYQDADYVHIVTPMMFGGELYHKIVAQGTFTEHDCKTIVKQLLEGLEHLHSHGICHRDLKPENIMFVADDSSDIKIIDFGLSKLLAKEPLCVVPQEFKMKTKIGTPYYVSPEILAGSYDLKCDIWAVGVIAYFMLCGQPPFLASNEAQLFQKIRNHSV